MELTSHLQSNDSRNQSRSWHPLISTLSPQEMLLRSCLIDLASDPASITKQAAQCQCGLLCMHRRTHIGAVATSTRGCPACLVVHYSFSDLALLVSSFRAESSPKKSIDSNLFVGLYLSISSHNRCSLETTGVEPSTTVFLIACRFGIGFAPIRAAIVRTTSTASESWFLGGDSSNSMRLALGDWTYSNVRFLLCSNLAATSVLPPSPCEARSLLVERGQC